MESLLVGLYRRLRLPIKIKQKLIWLLHPKSIIGVLAYIPHPDRSNQVLLADHPYRGEISWSMPGGFVGKGELPEAAIQREVKEELGVEVRIERLMRAVVSEFGISLDLVYLCTLDNIQPSFQLSREIAEAKFFELEGLPEERMYPQHVSLIRLLASQTLE